MRIKNISESTIHFANFLGEGRALVINPGETSNGFVANKDRLNTLICHSKKIEILVENANEMNMAADLDPRVSSLVKL